MDRLTAIELFTRIADTGSLTAAAERMGLSRGMASRYLQDLEARLGVRLVNRTTRRLSLTEPGRAYHQRCQQILADLEEAERAVASAGAQPRGRLRVSAPMTFGTLYLAPLLPAYLAEHPEVGVELVLNDRYVDLLEEGFDVAVRIGRLADSSLVVRRLAHSRLVLCAAPDYLARRGTPATAADLAEHDCLGYAYWSRGDAWDLIGPEGPVTVKLHGRLKANNGEALAIAAAGGLGIVLEPCFILAPHLRRGTLVPILPGYEAPEAAIHAVFPEGRRVSAKVRSFVEFLAGRLSPVPPWERPDEPPAAGTEPGPRRASPA